MISILHFSDIHFNANRNVVFQRKEKIFEAIKNHLKGKEFLFLITSGDIAYSGNSNEYDVALEFYKYLFKSIKEYTDSKFHFVFVPGNHDCLINNDTNSVRKLLLESLSEKGLSELSEEVLKICCIPQDNYFNFLKSLNSKLDYNGDVVFEHPLLKIVTFKIENKIIKFNCYNTAWDSNIHEKIGNLKFPIDYLYDQIPSVENFLSISVIHHPFNWQTPANSKELREALAMSSEILISGHEHQGDISIFSELNQQYNTIHIESFALQETNNDRESFFNIIDIDLTEFDFQVFTYSYDNTVSRYLLKNTTLKKKIEKEKKLKSKPYQLKATFLSKLENPGATYYNSNVDEIKLSDIYIPPYFNNVTLEKEKKTKFFNFIHSTDALEINVPNKFFKLILGEESSGKTALLKSFYLKYYYKGFYPIFLSVNDIIEVREDKLKGIIEKKFKDQYDELEKIFSDINFNDVVIMIDDFHLFKPKKSKLTLINILTKLFSKIVITGNELMLFESYTNKRNEEVELFELFDNYIIQEFNPTLRNQLITKWYRLGKDYMDNDEKNTFFHQIDLATENVNIIIGKNLVPSFPVFILTILQALETGQSDATSNNLHAYYYEYLITKSLKQVLEDKEDIGFYITLSKEYFYFLFISKIRFSPVSKTGFTDFIVTHSNKYGLENLNIETILKILSDSRIIKLEDDYISVSYKYLYYYFVAKYLSDNLDCPEVKETIELMADRLFRDEYSNIMLFLTHLSKNTYIISKLIEKSRAIFAEANPFKLEDDVDFINSLQKTLPQRVIEDLDIEKSRQQDIANEDKYEKNEKEDLELKKEEDYDLYEDLNSLDYISQLTKALRTLSILGHLAKKYWGELFGTDKLSLSEETYLLGLRTLNFHFGLLKEGKDILSEQIIKIIQKKFIHQELTRVQIENISGNFIFTLASSAVFGILKKIVNSIGTEKLSNTFEALQKKHAINSVKLINVGIKLDYYDQFPMNDIESLKNENEKNPLGFSTLQNMVTDYLYMYPISIEKRQKICEMLQIKIQEQRLIAETSQIMKQ